TEAAPPRFLAALKNNFTGGLELLALRRRWPPRFTVSFDQIAALLAVNLALWAGLDFLHAEPHAPLALDGLFGWACYLLLGLAAGALVARAESREIGRAHVWTPVTVRARMPSSA